MNDYLKMIPAIVTVTVDADALDIKRTDADLSLREFAVGFLGYQPGWIMFLYRVRAMVVPLLGLKQDGVPEAIKLLPSALPMQPGEMFGFFKVEDTAEDHYWIASASDDHLTAYLGIVCEPGTNGMNHFYALTAVHYHNWAGPVYYTLIRPFHHLVVGSMLHAGKNYTPAQDDNPQATSALR